MRNAGVAALVGRALVSVRRQRARDVAVHVRVVPRGGSRVCAVPGASAAAP